MRYPSRIFGAALTVGLFALPPVLGAQVTQEAEGTGGSYGYIRALEGSAYLIGATTGERIEVEVNEPLLTGDQVFTAAGARAELLLSDRNIVRLSDAAQLELRSLAASPDDRNDRTILFMRRGLGQLVVPDAFLGTFYPTVETPDGVVQLLGAGAYLIEVTDGTTVITVRQGSAQVETGNETMTAAAGEEVVVAGAGQARMHRRPARGTVALERWGQRLASEYGGEVPYVDEELRYAAAPMASHGKWVHVGGAYAWRPYVGAGWRPYLVGRWRYTPSGLLWVSYEPWGWVPYHYGYWNYVSGYGWLWYPGRYFAPAWVVWYWGPAYVGWVPYGYYRHHYGFKFRFGFGTHGYAYGPARHFRHWTFVPCERFGHRYQQRWALEGYDIGHGKYHFDAGIVTTDTRPLASSGGGGGNAGRWSLRRWTGIRRRPPRPQPARPAGSRCGTRRRTRGSRPRDLALTRACGNHPERCSGYRRGRGGRRSVRALTRGPRPDSRRAA